MTTLKRVPLFSRVSDRDLKKLAKLFKQRVFPAGATVASEGGEGVGFFVIEDGQALVTHGDTEVARLGPGDWIGEMALIDNGTRTATVTAEGELRCWGLTAWEFRPFVQSHAEVAWPLLEALVTRIRQSNADGAAG